MTVRRNEGRPAATGTASNLFKLRQQDNSTKAQRQRLLAALRRCPVTTIEARRDLDIMAPTPRIFELHQRGFQIVTIWAHQATDCRRDHRVARNMLIKGHV